VSFDLIYARPGQTLAAWEAELARAIGFGTEHLSLYQLTIEPGTRFATEAAAGRIVIPDGDSAADLFEMTRAITAAAGLPAYEISNWWAAVARNQHGMELEEPLAPGTRATEALLMGLRLREGVDLARIAQLGATTIPQLIDLPALEKLAARGWARRDGDRLLVTEAGMLLLDAILPIVVKIDSA
jgi:coproporphyrinogen III oxidase-like Fe-S oxidoreductase